MTESSAGAGGEEPRRRLRAGVRRIARALTRLRAEGASTISRLPFGQERALALLEQPDETRRFDKGTADLVRRDPPPFARVIVEPGWRFSWECEPGRERSRHAGYVHAGRLAVRSQDGATTFVGPGEALVIARGDDAWTVGDEPCVFFDLTAPEDWGKPSD